MPARVVLVAESADFIERMLRALCDEGHDIVAFDDPFRALDTLDRAERIDLLITKMQFGTGRPNGVSLALVAKTKRPDVKTLFISRPQFAKHARNVGEVLLYPFDETDLVRAVERLLTHPDTSDASS